MAVVVSCELFT